MGDINQWYCNVCDKSFLCKSKMKHLGSIKHMKKEYLYQNYDKCECGRMKSKNYEQCYVCSCNQKIPIGYCVL